MFHIDRNHKIYITQGDSAEIDMRIFNQDHEPRFLFPPFHKHYPWPLHQALDSEGNPIFNDGNPLLDSEGKEIWPWTYDKDYWKDRIHPVFRTFLPPLHSPFRPRLQEELIEWNDQMNLKVVNLKGEPVLEKTNDEYPNTIFLDPEDTQEIEPGLYRYQLTYINTDEEINTTITSFFEVVDKY